MHTRTTIGSLLAAALAAGCAGSTEPVEHPCPEVTTTYRVALNDVRRVDLLFMVDNSNSMAEEQASLAAELEAMVRILATGDFDQDGSLAGPADFEPVDDLNVGVITSDMGAGGRSVPTCDAADFGDDGVLRTVGRTDVAGCMATYPSFLNFQPGWHEGTEAQFAADVACVATVGTGGCGFEQQLEAILKALSPSAPTAWTAPGFTPPMFHLNTRGHADNANAGFVRDDSVLAIIPVTDEEDCSAADPELFDPASTIYGATDLNLRCWAHAEALHPVRRYVEGLAQLRRRPNLLVYAPIVGVPTDLAQGEDPATGSPTPIDWDRLVGPTDGTRDERMVERVDPTMENRLVPSCNVPGRGIAFPPVRMVEVARELDALGAGVTVQSICQESFAPALRGVIRHIASAFVSDCVPRPFYRREDGGIDCDFDVLVPEGQTCDALSGTEPLLDDAGAPVTEDGRSLCRLPQLLADGAVPEGDGWYYDDFSPTAVDGCGGARIEQTVELPFGGVVRLTCSNAWALEMGFNAVCELGPPPYDDEDGACGGRALYDVPLRCDPVWHTCGVPCESNYDCQYADLRGYICDGRPLSELHPGLASDAPHAFCVNPTCG